MRAGDGVCFVSPCVFRFHGVCWFYEPLGVLLPVLLSSRVFFVVWALFFSSHRSGRNSGRQMTGLKGHPYLLEWCVCLWIGNYNIPTPYLLFDPSFLRSHDCAAGPATGQGEAWCKGSAMFPPDATRCVFVDFIDGLAVATDWQTSILV
jgi:hypothetical protein